MRSGWAPARWIAIGFSVAVLLVVLDQWSKGAVFAWLGTGPEAFVRYPDGVERLPLAGDWLALTTMCNPGAAFGQFGDYPWVLVCGRILAAGFLTWLILHADPGHRVTWWSWVLILAGAIGNLIDNLWTGCGSEVRPHGVRDFIDVWFEPLFGWSYHFPSFNVADSCISVGACLWVLAGLFHRRHPEEEVEEGAASANEGQTP